jgi:hypothetical protein
MIFGEVFILDKVFELFDAAISRAALGLIIENVQFIFKMVDRYNVPVYMVLHYGHLPGIIRVLLKFYCLEVLNRLMRKVSEQAV